MTVLRIIFSIAAFCIISPIGVTRPTMLFLHALIALLIGFTVAYLVAIPIRMMLQIKQRDYPNE